MKESLLAFIHNISPLLLEPLIIKSLT